MSEAAEITTDDAVMAVNCKLEVLVALTMAPPVKDAVRAETVAPKSKFLGLVRAPPLTEMTFEAPAKEDVKVNPVDPVETTVPTRVSFNEVMALLAVSAEPVVVKRHPLNETRCVEGTAAAK